MVSVSATVHIRRDLATVFDYFADLRNEAIWNRGHVRDLVMTPPPPIVRGMTFQGKHVGFGCATWELVEYEHPRHLVMRGLVGRGTYSYEGDLEPTTTGCVLHSRIVWQPVGIV